MDRRDQRTWVVLELSPLGEKAVEENTLERDLRRTLNLDDSHGVFIPFREYEKDGRKTSIALMEGYAFIASGLDEYRYFDLERGRFVDRVLSSRDVGGMRVLKTVSEEKINQLRQQLHEEVSKDFQEGDSIVFSDGLYKHLSGTILEVESDYVTVFVKLRSAEIITRSPKLSVRLESEDHE